MEETARDAGYTLPTVDSVSDVDIADVTDAVDGSMCGGALRSPSDPNDLLYERAAAGGEAAHALPPELDLRADAGLAVASPCADLVARDQGLRSTCAAFAAAVIKEIHERRHSPARERLSPEFIYSHRVNKPTSGMYGRDVFQILRRIGTVPEADFPYDPLQEQEVPADSPMYDVAAQHRIANFARVLTVSGLRRALYEIGPCYMQLPLFRTRPEFWRQGVEDSVGAPARGHAVAVIGYTTVGFVLLNSWGAGWNGDGTVVMPYEDWPCHWECWVPLETGTVVGITADIVADTSPETLRLAPRRRGKIPKYGSFAGRETTKKQLARLSLDREKCVIS